MFGVFYNTRTLLIRLVQIFQDPAHLSCLFIVPWNFYSVTTCGQTPYISDTSIIIKIFGNDFVYIYADSKVTVNHNFR